MNKDELFDKVAKEKLRVDTLEIQNSDSLDFHTVSVWSLKKAFEQIYEAGRNSVK